MVNSAQMIITRWGEAEAVSLSGPTLPGIVAAFDEDPTAEEILIIAREAGLDPSGFVEVSVEHAFTFDDVTYFVRMHHDFHAPARAEVCFQIAQHLASSPKLREFVTPDGFGEAVIIGALEEDSIRSVLKSLVADQSVTVATVDSKSEKVRGINLVMGNRRVSPTDSGATLTDVGLNLDSSVAEMIRSKASHRELLHV